MRTTPKAWPHPSIECWGWLEDIDLNAGAAALAAIPVTEQHHIKLSGTDTIVAPQHVTWLCRIEVSDETAPTTDAGALTISGYDSVIPLPVVQVGGPGYGVMHFANPLPIPPGASLSVTGNGSGAGAEEHAVILFIDNPANDGNPWPTGSIPTDAIPHRVEMVTDAPAAAYRATTVEISGRTNAYTNSEQVLPDMDNIAVYWDAVQAELTAGYTLIVVEDNLLEKYLMFPCASTYDRKVYFEDYIGGALVSKASECHLLGVSGVTNATQQTYMDLYVKGWKAWSTGKQSATVSSAITGGRLPGVSVSTFTQRVSRSRPDSAARRM
jgi:hypothetical protein